MSGQGGSVGSIPGWCNSLFVIHSHLEGIQFLVNTSYEPLYVQTMVLSTLKLNLCFKLGQKMSV